MGQDREASDGPPFAAVGSWRPKQDGLCDEMRFPDLTKTARGGSLAVRGLPMGVAQQGDPAGQQYAAADGLQKRGVYNLAAQEWTKFLRLFPNDAAIAHAHHFLGVCYYQHGKAERRSRNSRR